MRIVTRQEFLSVPSGTMYMKLYHSGYKMGPFVKMECVYNDWFYIDCGDIDDDDAIECMKKDSTISSAMSTTPTRDASFDENDMFLIYEDNDIKELISLLSGQQIK